MSPLQTLLATLIRFQSVTPNDAGCQAYMMNYLTNLGFTCQPMDNPPVANFYASIGSGQPIFMFAGHTDVVPVGDRAKWRTPPFELNNQEGILYGRGVADMKGSLACMLLAAKRFVESHPKFNGTLSFLITSGEEGDDYDKGTPFVMQQLQAGDIHPTYCVVGEPSSTMQVGDVIKVGRRGSLNAELTLHGKQGHVAYPHLAKNPIHDIAPILAELSTTLWDKGNAYFPPTSFQITRIQSGGYGNNVIPGDLILNFNVRYSTEQTAAALMSQIEACFLRHQLTPEITWRLSGEPFLTNNGVLLKQCIHVIESQAGQSPELSTTGGTSDGRFIAPFGVEVIELGPVNASIHQVNEHVALADLERLEAMYYGLCEALLL